ncbi:MAG: HAMP domain-containing histidine kinase [Clostridiales bacterium]|nr:HAMP domain-containing histidine kinase [Clostridiales bacterium]
MVFASSNLNIYQKVFRLDYALDISVIQSLLSDISRKAAVQLFVMEILLFIFISIVVSRALRPLNVLREHTQKIANGLYDERVKVFRGDEVGQLAASVNQMSQAISESVESLKEAAHTKELLASNLAHELKTPLTSVVAYADYAIQKDLGKEEMNGILEYIRKEGRRLSDLSDKILKWNSISRLDSIDIKPCRPQRVIEQALYTLRPMAQAKNQLIEVNCHVEVIHADEALFVSLIVNLTKNALNASADSDTVRLFINNSGCGDLVLCVEDYGIGIQNTELEKITEPFYMVDKARDRSKGGSGLGLSLCAAIVNTHKGSMKIDSVYGEGTQVAVTIPQG